MGYVICGPVGTGKTFLTTCFAGEVGIPAVTLKNFRSMWQGVTEGNLERVLNLLKAMSPIAVIVDEADAQLGDRSSSGDSGVSNRVFAQIAQFMGNTEYRGKVIWFLLTCRPDLLAGGSEAPGPRRGAHRAVLSGHRRRTPGHAARHAEEDWHARRLGGCGEVLPRQRRLHLSGADIEAVLVRARMKSALEGDAAVDVDDLKAAIADFIPPSYPTEIELQNLVAVLECTSQQPACRREVPQHGPRRDPAPRRRTRIANSLAPGCEHCRNLTLYYRRAPPKRVVFRTGRRSIRYPMPRVFSFHVSPKLPTRLKALTELALNLRWSWDHPTIELFRTLDRDLWEATGHNPHWMLGRIDQKRYAELETDEAFLAQMDRAAADLASYLNGVGWFGRTQNGSLDLRVAYFSAEFGISRVRARSTPAASASWPATISSPPATSACRSSASACSTATATSASTSTPTAGSRKRYPDNDFSTLPARAARSTADGKPLHRHRAIPGQRRSRAKVWQIQVGRVPLYLLDTNVPAELAPRTAESPARSTAATASMRIQQEIVLGIGGVRALQALGIRPDRLPHERRPLRVPRPRAHPRS